MPEPTVRVRQKPSGVDSTLEDFTQHCLFSTKFSCSTIRLKETLKVSIKHCKS